MGRPGRPPLGERAMTAAEKMRRYRARKFGNKPKEPPVTKSPEPEARTEQLVREINERNQSVTAARIAELEAELAQEGQQHEEARARYWDAHATLVLHRDGIFTRAEYKKIAACLHPDRVQDDREKKRYTEAFGLFSRCEKLLKKEPRPLPPDLPRTPEEWLEARRQVKEQNRARARKAAETRARKKPGRQLREGR
jgi:hypothetical protein